MLRIGSRPEHNEGLKDYRADASVLYKLPGAALPIMDPDQLAEAVRTACLQAAIAAYDDAGLRGLCEEGRWEAAVGALQSIDLHKLIQELERASKRPV